MKIKIYGYWNKWEWEVEPRLYITSTGGIEDRDHTLCGEMDIDFNPEPYNQQKVDAIKIKSFRKEQGELKHKIDLIEEKIQKLLCLPSSGENREN